MDAWPTQSEAAFDAYVEWLTEVIGHADRAEPLTADELDAIADSLIRPAHRLAEGDVVWDDRPAREVEAVLPPAIACT